VRTVPVLIPAYKPDRKLVTLVGALRALGLKDIIVIDDGSGRAYDRVFRELTRKGWCRLLTHAVNLGKGRALKTGFNHVLTAYGSKAPGVVTADADGQHRPEDILRVAHRMAAHPRAVVLGVRAFDGAVPWRSRFGNRVTRHVLRFVAGLTVTDSQTGLRGLPMAFVPHCLALEGERYEYETNMLVAAGARQFTLSEVPIATVYIENNRSSHFNPLFDSMKIYFVLLRFAVSSLVTSGIDMVVFGGCLAAHLGVPAAMLLARLVAGNFNYFTNEKLVFEEDRWSPASLAKYWALVCVLGTAAYAGIRFLSGEFGLNVILAKVLVESALFVASFTIQRDLVFVSGRTRA